MNDKKKKVTKTTPMEINVSRGPFNQKILSVQGSLNTSDEAETEVNYKGRSKRVPSQKSTIQNDLNLKDKGEDKDGQHSPLSSVKQLPSVQDMQEYEYTKMKEQESWKNYYLTERPPIQASDKELTLRERKERAIEHWLKQREYQKAMT